MNRKVSLLNRAAAVLCMAALILLDQFTKRMAVLHLKNQPSFVLVEGVLKLHYLENRGAAFGIMQGQKTFLLLIGVLLLGFLAYYYVKMPASKRFLPLRILIVFVGAGAVGNMIDRMLYEYVIDFFYFELIDFPIFNVADIYVTMSVAALVFLFLFYYKEEDLEFLSLKKKQGEKKNDA